MMISSFRACATALAAGLRRVGDVLEELDRRQDVLDRAPWSAASRAAAVTSSSVARRPSRVRDERGRGRQAVAVAGRSERRRRLAERRDGGRDAPIRRRPGSAGWHQSAGLARRRPVRPSRRRDPVGPSSGSRRPLETGDRRASPRLAPDRCRRGRAEPAAVPGHRPQELAASCRLKATSRPDDGQGRAGARTRRAPSGGARGRLPGTARSGRRRDRRQIDLDETRADPQTARPSPDEGQAPARARAACPGPTRRTSRPASSRNGSSQRTRPEPRRDGVAPPVRQRALAGQASAR